MFKINLEKKLLRENKNIFSKEESLFIKEAEDKLDLANNETLKRLGLLSNIRQGLSIKENFEKVSVEIDSFNKEKVFHISQIKSLCDKYYLRFLPIEYYKGKIDTELPFKLSQFEIAHKIELRQRDLSIMAPHKSFELEEKPKDPLMFYKINNDWYYLIHKWGNDLNIFRRLLVLLSKPWFCIGLFGIIAPLVLFLFISTWDSKIAWFVFIITSIFVLFVLIVYQIIMGTDFDEGGIRILSKNKFDSYYK